MNRQVVTESHGKSTCIFDPLTLISCCLGTTRSELSKVFQALQPGREEPVPCLHGYSLDCAIHLQVENRSADSQSSRRVPSQAFSGERSRSPLPRTRCYTTAPGKRLRAADECVRRYVSFGDCFLA